jgi:hypothetical protein
MKEIFLQQLVPGSIGSGILTIAVLSVLGFVGNIISDVMGNPELKLKIGTLVKIGSFIVVIAYIGQLFAGLGKLTNGSMF